MLTLLRFVGQHAQCSVLILDTMDTSASRLPAIAKAIVVVLQA